MADDYARHALSQRASLEAIHPAVMAAAGRLASEPVLCVADLGAADGVNSHGLIRDLVAQRAGRPLIYALVDLPTNACRVAAAHLSNWPRFRVLPSPGMSRDDYSTADHTTASDRLFARPAERQRGLWLRRPGDSRRSAMRWRFH